MESDPSRMLQAIWFTSQVPLMLDKTNVEDLQRKSHAMASLTNLEVGLA
jgi:hypothetical protein